MVEGINKLVVTEPAEVGLKGGVHFLVFDIDFEAGSSRELFANNTPVIHTLTQENSYQNLINNSYKKNDSWSCIYVFSPRSSMFQRQTAKKVKIASLTSGTWEKHEGMNPSFVVTSYGDKVARARVMATVVAKFVAEDQMFASLTLDDSTDTLRAKTFKTVQPIGDVQVGELVDVIGKVREYNGEIYMIPEIVARVEDPNLELLRRVDIAQAIKAMGGEVTPEKKEELRKPVLEAIESEKDGMTYEALLKKVGKPEPAVEKVVNDLLAEGVCYEPTPGKIRKI